ncbi:MAG: hypothetical protein ABSD27_01030 [Bryobacteraceae bacterium]|jgi:hypothetical protein
MKRLLVGTAGIALFACACGAQTMVEHSLVTAGAASAGAGMKKAGDSVGSALGKVSQTLDQAGASAKPGASAQAGASARAGGASAKAGSTTIVVVPKGAASAAEGPNLAAPDPAAVKTGMEAAELVKRFGQPVMKLSDGGNETWWYGAGDDSVRVELRDGKVAAVSGQPKSEPQAPEKKPPADPPRLDTAVVVLR